MKVAELTGAKLDLLVCKAIGVKARIESLDGEETCWSAHEAFEEVPFSPSSQWSAGGPIIEQAHIATWTDGGEWRASRQCYVGYEGLASSTDDGGEISGGGRTPLEAAMRVFVTSKFGDEVPD